MKMQKHCDLNMLSVTGWSISGQKKTENLEIATGEVEVDINELTILNKAETPHLLSMIMWKLTKTFD